MIGKTLEFLRRNLDAYMAEKDEPELADAIYLGNIALLADPAYAKDQANGNESPEEKVIMSVVNIEEDLVHKNDSPVKTTNGLASTLKNPPIYVNLFVLFCANHSNYMTALDKIADVIAFFQGRRSFTFPYAPTSEDMGTRGLELFTRQEKRKFNLKLDLHTLNFEQINHLWGSLGGKQVPFVLYKVRMIEITADHKLEGDGVIEEIVVD